MNLEKRLRGFARPLVSALQLITQHLSWRCTRLRLLCWEVSFHEAVMSCGSMLLQDALRSGSTSLTIAIGPFRRVECIVARVNTR